MTTSPPAHNSSSQSQSEEDEEKKYTISTIILSSITFWLFVLCFGSSVCYYRESTILGDDKLYEKYKIDGIQCLGHITSWTRMQMSNSEGRPNFVITVRYTIESETCTTEHIPSMSTELSSYLADLIRLYNSYIYLPGFIQNPSASWKMYNDVTLIFHKHHTWT